MQAAKFQIRREAAHSSAARPRFGCRLRAGRSSFLFAALVAFFALLPGCYLSSGAGAAEDLKREVDLARMRLQAPETQEYIRRFEAWLARGRAIGHYPGVAVGVIVGDELIYSHYLNTGPERQYGLASITKTFTGLAMMQLIEQGRINLEDPVSKYLPGVQIARPELGSPTVRIRHLLSHTSGMPDLRYYRPPRFIQPAESGIGFAFPEQIYPAGSHYRYSNRGFMMLGEIIERVTGEGLTAYYDRALFQPMGMQNTGFRSAQPSGAFGIRTTLPDMAAYAAMWLKRGRSVTGEEMLLENSMQRMLEPPLYFPVGESHDYCGLAWRVATSPEGITSIYHIGGANGVMAWVQMFPRHNAAIVYLGDPPVMSDEVMGRIPSLQHKLAQVATLLVGAREPVNAWERDRADAETAQRLPGVYRNPLNGDRIYVKQEGAGYWMRRNRLSWQPLQASSAREFYSRYGLFDFTFRAGLERPEGAATVSEYFYRLDDAPAPGEDSPADRLSAR